jgi:serine/threonine-protein kinase
MSDQIERLTAALSERYRVERELGAGGMATVYLAHDLKHGRPVAIKVLRPELAAVVGADRFLKEIEVTAKLQHPNILPLYDSGEADGFLFYVMPFVEGESLRQRLDRERELPLEDAVAVARSVAAALRYAHERDVVHRDIKPENILIQAGQALVADFGIALAVRHADGGRLTETGLSLGTPHYMSPEQAAGDREIDARADVFALGAVAYEMLTGEPPHTGASPQAVLAKILTEPPAPISRTRSLVPSNVDAAIRVALAKAPADRFATAQQFVGALDDPTFALPTHPTAGGASGSKRGWLWPAAALVLAAALVWSLVDRPTIPTQVVRASLSLPENQGIHPSVRGLAFSPDGSSFVYSGPAETGSTLWLRRLDEAEARALPGTEGGSGPRFSLDGSRVSFAVYDGGWTLKVVSLADRSVTVVSDALGADVASWTSDDRIFFQGSGGLWSVRADGSDRVRVTFADSVPVRRSHGRPFVLPGDRGVLHTTTGGGMLGVLDLRTGADKPLGIYGGYAVYAASGHLLFSGRGRELFAVPFDVERLEVTGDPARLPFSPRRGSFGSLDMAVSDAGTLLYVSTERRRRETVWVSRDGSVRPVEPGWDGVMMYPRVHPEGTSLVGTIRSAGEVIAAVKPLDGSPLRRIGFDVPDPGAPGWHPRGSSVALTGDGVPYVVPLDGRAPVSMVEGFEASGAVWSPDGEWIVLVSSRGQGEPAQLYILGSQGDSTPRVLIGSGESETAPSISPDGRFVAYVRGGSSDGEVVVRPFPNVRDGQVQVSFGGGVSPVWSRDGRDLFYRDQAARMMVAHVDTSEGFRVVSVEPLFAASQYDFGWTWARYDVHPDGRSFAMVRQTGDEPVLVVNWFEELRRLFGEER